MDVHYSSKTDDWATPQSFFENLDGEFGFDLDVCADAKNAKASHYFTRADDGLSQSWTGTVWMNPPYGREIGKWVKKAYETAQQGHTVVCLLPSRTDTTWWHDYCATTDDIRFVRGRLNFGDGAGRAPFPSVVVVFRGERQMIEAAGNIDLTGMVRQPALTRNAPAKTEAQKQKDLAALADSYEDEVRYLRCEMRYASSDSERESIQSKIDGFERLLCNMHC